MKQIRFWIAFTLLVAAFIFGCDKVEEPFVRNTGGNGGNDTTEFVRKVLLEDYTGHKCVNCPGAAVVARELQEENEGKVIVISVHSGFFAMPSSSGLYTTDFRTAEGDELDQFFGVSALGNPQGMVNRIGEGTDRVLKPEEWAAAVGSELAKPVEASVEILTDFNEGSRLLETTVEVTFVSSTENVYRICVYITEDSIVAPQMNNDPTIGAVPDIEDYVHRHVLRGSVNGTWGDLVTDQAIVADSTYSMALNDFNLPTGWVAEHCSVVAFVYRQDNQEVIQAEEKHLN